MKKYMLSLVALLVAVAAMAFTNGAAPAEVAEEEAVAVQYQFHGSSMNDVYNTSLWSEIEDELPDCQTGNVVCVVTVPSGTLDAYLNARTRQQILNDATSRKN